MRFVLSFLFYTLVLTTFFQPFIMINILEFRIGNYVLVDNIARKICVINNHPQPAQASSIGYQVEEGLEHEVVSSSRVTAVPITDELLTNFGFTFQPHFKLWRHTRPVRSYSIELDKDYSALDFAHRPIVKNMQHLHSLQNLFFTVQGEELLADRSI